jgi:uncharacterized membrane protein HdeD (DUF308 family)
MSDAAKTPMTLEGRFPMVRELARAWGVFVFRGVAAILFGIFAFISPGLSLAVILGFLAAWMFIDGAGTLYPAFKGPAEKQGIWFWLDGIISILAGIAVLAMPGVAGLTLVYITGFWTIATGIIRIILAFRLGSILLGLLGAVAIFFGFWLIMNPGPGLLALIWIVGFEAIIMGGMLVAFGLRLRKVANDPHGPAVHSA